MEAPRDFDWHKSPLLCLALGEGRFDVWEFFGDGPYPDVRAEKDELEARVDALCAEALVEGVAEGLNRHRDYLELWVGERLEAANTDAQLARLVAFAELQYALEDAIYPLELRALGHPQPTDRLFAGRPELYELLDRDGMLPLTAANVPDSDEVFCVGDQAIWPHPHLAPLRELVWLLRDLAAEPHMRVSIAVNPLRRAALADVQDRLLEDYWQGIRLTARNLDSLDAHDSGVPTFHAALGRDEAMELFRPLLGTWFDWARRGDSPDDPVKRLYIREVRPTVDGFGRELLEVFSRELHTERDTSAHVFRHVDGKVCRYAAENYGPSAECPNARLPSPTHSRKLWRVDGELADEQFCELIGLHFRQNELVEEHFQEAFPAESVR